MDARQRRQEIGRIIEGESARPVSASLLAKRLGVSRQVIVGDIALLRAEGRDIFSTARGYVSGSAHLGRYTAKLACRHGRNETRDELYTIVDMGGHALDVIVEHAVYGEMTGRLELLCRRDVDMFMERLGGGGARLLSELTGGVHLHTISCADEAAFLRIKKALDEQGFLYPEK